jgi:hypothetical protein
MVGGEQLYWERVRDRAVINLAVLKTNGKWQTAVAAQWPGAWCPSDRQLA